MTKAKELFSKLRTDAEDLQLLVENLENVYFCEGEEVDQMFSDLVTIKNDIADVVKKINKELR